MRTPASSDHSLTLVATQGAALQIPELGGLCRVGCTRHPIGDVFPGEPWGSTTSFFPADALPVLAISAVPHPDRRQDAALQVARGRFGPRWATRHARSGLISVK